MRVIGLAEIERALNQMPERIARSVTKKAMMAGGKVIVAKAKVQAAANPSIDSGATVSKIGAEATKDGNVKVGVERGAVMVRRRGSDKLVKAVPSKTIHFLENGTKKMAAEPIFRPALDEGFVEAVQAIGEEFGRGVEREARALASGAKSFVTGKRL